MKDKNIRKLLGRLVTAGVSQTEIAESLEPAVTVSSVCDVIHGRRANARIRQAVADRLAEADGKAVTVGELFPETEQSKTAA